jgi:hypothetical protein
MLSFGGKEEKVKTMSFSNQSSDFDADLNTDGQFPD